VTVVGFEKAPFERVLGVQVGSALQKIHADNGIKFRLGRSVSEFQGEGAVKSVKLDNGEVLDADFVVLGVGVVPNTSYVKDVPKQANGAILVDEHLKAKENTFAAGDIATFPSRGENVRIEHWAVAQNQGSSFSGSSFFCFVLFPF
jgi:NADPH-dependent 2,4-dienoyl-CoA reductase/sulfur reductase-like enzyme